MSKRKRTIVGISTSNYRSLPSVDIDLLQSDFDCRGLTPPIGTLLVLGSSGTIGRWFTSALLQISKTQKLKNRVVLLGRDPKALASIYSPLAENKAVEYHPISQLVEIVKSVKPDHIFHLAAHTGSTSKVPGMTPYFADSQLTLSLLQAISSTRKIPRFLFTSSGAVYGRGRTNPDPPDETYPLSLEVGKTHNEYDAAKLVSELFLGDAARASIIIPRIARLYAFVGPLIPLDSHFAIGNFIKDGFEKKPICLTSRGDDYRSWMHFQDLTRSLFVHHLGNGSDTINIGSAERMTIREAAQLVSDLCGVDIIFPKHPQRESAPTCYYPELTRFNAEINLSHQIHLRESVKETLTWLTEQFPNYKIIGGRRGI